MLFPLPPPLRLVGAAVDCGSIGELVAVGSLRDKPVLVSDFIVGASVGLPLGD